MGTVSKRKNWRRWKVCNARRHVQCIPSGVFCCLCSCMRLHSSRYLSSIRFRISLPLYLSSSAFAFVQFFQALIMHLLSLTLLYYSRFSTQFYFVVKRTVCSYCSLPRLYSSEWIMHCIWRRSSFETNQNQIHKWTRWSTIEKIHVCSIQTWNRDIYNFHKHNGLGHRNIVYISRASVIKELKFCENHFQLCNSKKAKCSCFRTSIFSLYSAQWSSITFNFVLRLYSCLTPIFRRGVAIEFYCWLFWDWVGCRSGIGAPVCVESTHFNPTYTTHGSIHKSTGGSIVKSFNSTDAACCLITRRKCIKIRVWLFMYF